MEELHVRLSVRKGLAGPQRLNDCAVGMQLEVDSAGEGSEAAYTEQL